MVHNVFRILYNSYYQKKINIYINNYEYLGYGLYFYKK